jgi:hypothetical protein
MTHTDFNRLLSSINGLTPAQVRKLRQELDERLAQPKTPTTPTPRKPSKPTKTAAAPQKPMTRDEFRRHLIEIGLMSQLPDTAADFDDPDDEPVPIKG